jgi:hypothetical protein
MKKFVRRLLFFFVPPILVLLTKDIYLSKGLKNTSLAAAEYEVWNDLFYNNISPEVAIYGSSRAWVHIDPMIIEDSLGLSAYNFGIDGHNFWLQYYRHKTLLKNTTPKTIIHSVDINTLKKRRELYNYEQFLPYMLWNREIYEATKNYEGFNIVDFTIPLARYIGKNKTLNAMMLRSKGKSIRTQGFQGQNREWNDDLKRAKTQMGSYTADLDNASVELFRQYIQECKSLDINLILVYTPEYIEGQQFVTNRSEIMTLLKGIAQENNLPFLDYSDHYLSMDKKYFYNSMHLNATGAEIFTRILAHDIKQISAK